MQPSEVSVRGRKKKISRSLHGSSAVDSCDLKPVFFSEWLQAGESRGLRQETFFVMIARLQLLQSAVASEAPSIQNTARGPSGVSGVGQQAKGRCLQLKTKNHSNLSLINLCAQLLFAM